MKKMKEGNKIGLLTKNDYFSFKLKKPALNTQVCMDFEGWINWVSKSRPAGKWNDPAMMNDQLEEFVEVCFQR